MLIIILLILILLYRCGDIETNPGPIFNDKLKSLSICHVNIRGLNAPSLRKIKTELCDLYDVITISETFLSPNSTLDLTIPGYHSILRRDRPTLRGGLAIYIKENIGFKRLAQFESDLIEVMWLQLNTVQGKLLLCTAYRPPKYSEFWEPFERNIEQVKDEYQNNYLLLMGDLNADFETANGKKLIELCSSFNLTCHINEPTRFEKLSSTCLDQIISNMPNFLCSTTVTPPIASDHCTVGAQFKLKVSKELPYERLIWKYQQGDYPGFRQALVNADWDDCFHGDVNEACTKWTETFTNIARTYIPNKHVLIRPNDKPWFNNELRLLRRKVNRLFHRAKRSGNDSLWNRYKAERNVYQDKLNAAEERHKSHLAESLTKSRHGKHWWGTVNKLLGKGGDESFPAMKDLTNDSFVTDNMSKASLFNTFFMSHSNIDTSEAQLPNEEPIYPGPILDSLTATEEDVFDFIKSIDPNKATGPDGISPRLLKEAGHSIVPSLTKLFNLSLTTATVPESWKRANVIPVHKKGDKDVTNNYRPISLLCVVSKLFERVVFKKLYNFIHEHKLLTKFQSGFIPGDSTVNQLAFLYNFFCKALDGKKDVRIVFCDISKAFDRVWHAGLLYKLHKIGVRGTLLAWFQDYLTNRLQRVIIRGQNSEWGEIKAGVPQGSVLGPLLFLIYINDLVDGIQSNIRLFADDTTIFITVDDPETAATQLNNDMINIKSWADQWLVNFSPSKTKSMIISNRQLDHPPLYFDGSILENVTSHKHLGLTLTCDLSWSQHIKEIVSKASRMINVLRQFKYSMDRKSLECIYFTFIRPKLEYGSQIWDDCTERDKDLLNNVQLNAVRIVTGAKKGTKHKYLQDEIKWQSLSERRNNAKLQHMQKIVHNIAPSYLCELLPDKVITRGYATRNAVRGNYVEPDRRIDKYGQSFIPAALSLWNELDEVMRDISDHNKFKEAIVTKTSCNPLFYYGTRKANILHCQIRLHCSNLKAHLVELHVLDDPTCLCSYGSEDTKHFLLQCPLYYRQRMVLSNIVTTFTRFAEEILLFGDPNLDFETNCIIFSAVHNFITDSGRFT